MFAVINKYGNAVQLATKDLGKTGFSYVEIMDEEIVKAIRSKKSVKYINGAFQIVTPFRSKTWEQIRSVRDDKFLEADAAFFKTQDAEAIEALDLTDQKKSIALYRQELRDLPETFESPDDVVFPTPPF